LPAIKSLAGAVRREHRQVAGTPVGAVTGFNIISFPPPFAHRFHFFLEVLDSVRTGLHASP
jgi:hypothetical protein